MNIDLRRHILYLPCIYIENVVESRKSQSLKERVNATLHCRQCFPQNAKQRIWVIQSFHQLIGSKSQLLELCADEWAQIVSDKAL